jgi:DNA polymerase III psi subunit
VIASTWEKLGEKERELLARIISALKISIDSVTINSQKALDVTYFAGKTNKLIFFGETPAGVARYEVLESADLSFICSESLTQLIDNESARKQLWLGLRKLFSI